MGGMDFSRIPSRIAEQIAEQGNGNSYKVTVNAWIALQVLYGIYGKGY
jgi:hypothetical protein